MKRQPIVLLHGWGLSGNTFGPLVDELNRRGHRVYILDFPGFGASQMPEQALSLSDYVEFLSIFLKKHKIEQPVLIGHSFGGRVALKYQQLYPKSTRALILTGTPGFTPISRKKLILFILMAKIGNAFFSLPPFSLIQGVVRKWYYYLVGARDFYRAEGVMRGTFKRIVAEDLTISMRSVTVPCLLLWGKADTIVPISVAYKMKEAIPGAKLEIIEESDHGVPYRNPKVFADHVETFLRAI